MQVLSSKTLASWLALTMVATTAQWPTANARLLEPAPTANAQPVPPTPRNCNAIDFKLPQDLLDVHRSSGLPPFVSYEIFGTVSALQGGWGPGLNNTEAPILARMLRLIDLMNWNCAASYSSTWLDGLTLEDPPVRTPKSYEFDTNDVEVDTNDIEFDPNHIVFHASTTRHLCMVHAWAAVVQDWVPKAYEPLSGILTALGYQNVDYGFNEEVDAAFNLQTGRYNPSKLRKVAANNCYNPKIMGAIVARYVTEYARRDGFNMYGDLGGDNKPCEYNCHQYTDTTGYEPLKKKRGPGKVLNKFRWKPILEDHGQGHFAFQVHVTPHIGKRAKLAVLSDEDFSSRMVIADEYDYDEAARKVTQRLHATATNEMLKAQIEFYADKIELHFAIVGAVVSYGLTFEQFLGFQFGLAAGAYDAVLVAWNIKVKNDRVRPTTWIKEQMTNEYFDTYAGPFQGSKSIRGGDFETYIPVEPHSEYMSASACICQSLKDFTDEWMEQTHGQLNITGSAFFSYTKGGSIAVPISTELGRPVPFQAGGSKIEPGHPTQNLDLVAMSMTELRDQCGESRLNGGMNFERSVPDAYHVCEGIGDQAADYAMSLLGKGNWNDAIAEEVSDGEETEEKSDGDKPTK